MNRQEKTTRLLNDSLEAISLGSVCLFDSSTLFKAIQNISEKNSEAYNLAKIGQYISDDWGNMMECEHKNLTEGVEEGGG